MANERKKLGMKRILVLGAPIFQIEVIKKAKEMGNYIGAIDINDDAPAFPYADETFVCSIRDFDAVLRIALKFKPDGIIIGACDTSVVTGARLCSELGLPGHSIETAKNSTDKVRMLEVFEAHNVTHPKFQVVKRSEISNYKRDISFPLITKPTDSAGGRGVSIVHSEKDLKSAIIFSSEAGVSGDVLVEEYMKGPEVSVEVLVIDNIPYILQITDKITSGEPNFYEIGHSQPTTLSKELKDSISRLASDAVLAVGINNSPAHVEIIITEDGPKMVELGARLGGDCITSYLIDTSVVGINMIEATIDLSLGKSPDISKYTDSGICSGVRFIPATEGLLNSISGVNDAEKQEGVIKIRITGKTGQYYSKATDDSARFGYVVCEGRTTNEALNRCEKAIEYIKFEVI